MKRAFQLMFLCSLVLVCGCQEKVGVLISSNNVTIDDIAYHSVWWYDTVLFQELLETEGYDRIYVLYGFGSDFNSKHDCYNATARFGGPITDFECDRSHIESIFDALANGGTIDGVQVAKMRSNSRLFVWWMGHGGGTNSTNYSMDISHQTESVSGIEFAEWINRVNTAKRSVHVMTCHAGCFEITGVNTVTETSSTCAQSSYEMNSPPDVNHAEYSYWLYAALREHGTQLFNAAAPKPCLSAAVASDGNGDGHVTLMESFTFVDGTMVTSDPIQADPDGLATSEGL